MSCEEEDTCPVNVVRQTVLAVTDPHTAACTCMYPPPHMTHRAQTLTQPHAHACILLLI
jgi:hypothetical protein